MTELDWTAAGPRSTRFDDVYFSAQDGLAESRAVFLKGCGLPDAWAGRDRFTIGELGFGTGLNILAALDLWRAHRPRGATLHLFSVEAFPLTAEQATRALGAWPELADLTGRLLDRWPAGQGARRVDWPDIGATLDLWLGEALDGVRGWDGRADAWFLDGFAPATNPQMWRPELIEAVAARSAPGARVATFTVAGHVRRLLAAAGFTATKQPGFGRKRERLEAVLPGAPKPAPRLDRVAVVGSGIAGASVVRALRALRVETTVVAPRGASEGPPAALVSPRFDSGDEAPARLMRQAFARAVDRYTDAPDSVIGAGLIQLSARARDGRRFEALDGAVAVRRAMAHLSPEEVARRLGEPVSAEGLYAPEALTVDPACLMAAWLADVDRVEVEVLSVERAPSGWRVLGQAGLVLAEATAVVLAGGWRTSRLWSRAALAPIRGQLAYGPGSGLASAVAWGGYLTPTRDGILFGATHDRDDTDDAVRLNDHARNLAALAARLPTLAASIDPEGLQGWAGVRATTPDRLPLAGQVGEGVFVLAGLGGRGFTTAPLLGEHVAARLAATPSPLPRDLAALVDPLRFE